MIDLTWNRSPIIIGVINFIYMFRVWGPNNFMLMFASRIVGSSEIKLSQQKGVFRSIISRCGCVRVRRGYLCMCVAVGTDRPVCAPRLF